MAPSSGNCLTHHVWINAGRGTAAILKARAPRLPGALSGHAPGPNVAQHCPYVGMLIWNSLAVTAFTGVEAHGAMLRVADACMHACMHA